MRKYFLTLGLALFFLFLFRAQAEASGNYFSETGAKFGRGIENVITSPAEIPCTMESEMHKGDRIIRFFSGFGKGTVYFLRRAIVGATEVVTFPIPMKRTIPRVCIEEPTGVII